MLLQGDGEMMTGALRQGLGVVAPHGFFGSRSRQATPAARKTSAGTMLQMIVPWKLSSLARSARTGKAQLPGCAS